MIGNWPTQLCVAKLRDMFRLELCNIDLSLLKLVAWAPRGPSEPAETVNFVSQSKTLTGVVSTKKFISLNGSRTIRELRPEEGIPENPGAGLPYLHRSGLVR